MLKRAASLPPPDPTPQLAAVQAQLRKYTVWRAEEYPIPESGTWGVERFVSVIEDGLLFERLQTRVQEIEGLYREAKLLGAPERRMPGFFNEVWDHAAVHVNQAWESHRVREHAFPLGNSVDLTEWPALQVRLTAEHAELIGQLQDLGLKVVEVRGVRQEGVGTARLSPVLYLEARRGRRFTVRRNTQRAFRLYASTADGLARANVRVGVVVVRGLLSEVREQHPRRKARKDALGAGVRVGKYEVVPVD